ncbi:killer cell lectin-like receptor subfamily F member 1 [Ambystoma mexicanum]|uniref:killer cell lectin-like receptor subfamily F member 1 n=1 Tax=Ambystoma mexicanum TaxID=8296 RepID=UPI0037E77660
MEDEEGYTALRFQGRTKPKDEGEVMLQADLQCPPWQRWMLWLSGSLNVLLILTVVGCGVWIAKGSTQGNSKHGIVTAQLCSNSGFAFEKIALTSEGLKDHLCGESNESTCEICPYKWVMSKGRCYFVSEGFLSWDSGRDYCRSRKADLINLEDANEIDFLEEIDKSVSYLWIGLQYNETTGEWIWLNGSRLQEGSIAVEPRRPGHTCGAYSGMEIFPEQCSSKNKWVCEKEAIQFDKR